MNLATELLVSSHQADLRREASRRRLAAVLERCRTWLFGIVPVGRPCDASCT
jgi:hypothetical protein